MPQWEFLDFVAREAGRYPNFRLVMQAEVTELIEEGGRIAGLRASLAERRQFLGQAGAAALALAAPVPPPLNRSLRARAH